MWVCLSGAFLSIVAHRERPAQILVRARLAGDIVPRAAVGLPWAPLTADYVQHPIGEV